LFGSLEDRRRKNLEGEKYIKKLRYISKRDKRCKIPRDQRN